MSKIHTIALASALAAGGASATQLEACTPNSPGYQRFPSTSLLPAITEGCNRSITHALKFETVTSFEKAKSNGKDSGRMLKSEISPVVNQLNSEARSAIDETIKSEGASLVGGGNPRVKIQGNIHGPATPDLNIERGTLITSSGTSPTYALYRITPEVMKTAELRCQALLDGIPKTLTVSGKQVEVSKEALNCIPTPKVLDINTWSAPLTTLGAELIDKGVVPPKNWDEAELLAIKLANGTASLPNNLSKASLETITKLGKEFEAMRVVPMKGTLGVTVSVNKTDVHWWNVAGYAAVIAFAALFIGIAGTTLASKNRDRLWYTGA